MIFSCSISNKYVGIIHRICQVHFLVSYEEEWVSEYMAISDTPLILIAFRLSMRLILLSEVVNRGDDCKAIPLSFLRGIATLDNS